MFAIGTLDLFQRHCVGQVTWEPPLHQLQHPDMRSAAQREPSGWVPISGISSNSLGIPKSSHKSSRQLFLPAPPHEDFYREVLKIFFHPSVYPWSFRPKIIIKILFLLYFFFSNIASLNICPKFTLLFLITEFILTSCTSSIHFWVQLSWWLKILLKYNLFLHSKTRNEDTSV